MTWWKTRHLYLLLFAVYPAAAFLANNAGQLRPGAMTRPLLLSIAFGALVLLLLRAILKSWTKAAIGTTLCLLVAFSYGHVYWALKETGLSGATVVRHRYLVPVMLGALGLGILLIARSRPSGSTVAVLNLVGAIALAGPIVQLAGYYGPQASAGAPALAAADECTLHLGAEAPDIYLIILDAYERDDVLLAMHGYDNAWFLEALESQGFFIGRGSLSNYRHTEMTLASMLNMTYIQDFPERFGTVLGRQWGIVQRINENDLRRELECAGYTIVAFESGAFWTEWTDADYYLRRGLADPRSLGMLSRSDVKFLDTTLARVALDAVRQQAQGDESASLDVNADHRDRIEFVFSSLADVAALPSPKFVFAHVISPHSPIVFGPNGEHISHAEFETDSTEGEMLQLYADQVNYLNQLVLEAVQGILASSDSPPVIIVMGDHGWADRKLEDKLSILNAIHLPGDAAASLYPTITPINTIRLVLGEVLGGDLGLLQDASYYSPETDTFDFQLVPNSWEP